MKKGTAYMLLMQVHELVHQPVHRTQFLPKVRCRRVTKELISDDTLWGACDETMR